MAKEGILLALCSKNNLIDVDNVLKKHEDMILDDNDIVIKQVNWDNKVENIKKISQMLNLNLDSFVFLDDSDFEINLVQTYLPMVKVLKVPSNIEHYPNLLRKSKKLFYQFNKSEEDSNKTKLYKQRTKRIEYETKFTDVNQYLESLQQVLKLSIDPSNQVERLSQITQNKSI